MIMMRGLLAAVGILVGCVSGSAGQNCGESMDAITLANFNVTARPGTVDSGNFTFASTDHVEVAFRLYSSQKFRPETIHLTSDNVNLLHVRFISMVNGQVQMRYNIRYNQGIRLSWDSSMGGPFSKMVLVGTPVVDKTDTMLHIGGLTACTPRLQTAAPATTTSLPPATTTQAPLTTASTETSSGLQTAAPATTTSLPPATTTQAPLTTTSTETSSDYIGCTQRYDQMKLSHVGVHMNLGDCRNACLKDNQSYFAVGMVVGCYCNQTMDPSLQMDHPGCNKPCPGNHDEICGGYVAASVYRVYD